jgi:hypothetical protein
MRESINHTAHRGETYPACADVRSYHVQFTHRDGTVGMECDNFVASPEIMDEFIAYWQNECEAGYTIVSDRPHFQRSQFPSFEVNLILGRELPKLVEARKVWEQYIGWKTICTTAAAGEGLVG